ncbi:hypothetical protein F503_05449 [Ophiostoma piceae UAMH 11346]|uniref:Uncharacterized protein n=1 Tax=Ophiostoma piceae (strain UAMH 11346) TaxID=1262450 RepID=S3CA06_OPHP1|nr:hypothetical protein F503_05449 [Ophiostoma piceae UAMH 11346]
MASSSIGSPLRDEGQSPVSETNPPSDYSDSSIDAALLHMLEDAEEGFGNDDFDSNDVEYPADSPVPQSPENSADLVADGADDSVEDSLAGFSNDELERVYESSVDHVYDEVETNSENSVGPSPAGTTDDSADEGIEDSPEGSSEGSLEDSPENSQDDSIEDDSSSDSHEVLGDNQNQNGHDHESINDLDLDVADGINSSSIPDDIDIEEVFLRAAYDDSPASEWGPGDARAETMPQTRRRSVVESTASSTPTRLPSQQSQTSIASPSRLESAQALSGGCQASASQRSASKRRRSDEPDGMPGSSAATGLTPSRLPPISSLLESIGGSSSGTQRSQARPQTSPKRLKREEPIIIDDLFGSDDDGVEVVNLVDVDRPKATQDESEPAPAPEPEPVPEAPSASLVKFSGLQCVICMDDMSNLTVTHCGPNSRCE